MWESIGSSGGENNRPKSIYRKSGYSINFRTFGWAKIPPPVSSCPFHQSFINNGIRLIHFVHQEFLVMFRWWFLQLEHRLRGADKNILMPLSSIKPWVYSAHITRNTAYTKFSERSDKNHSSPMCKTERSHIWIDLRYLRVMRFLYRENIVYWYVFPFRIQSKNWLHNSSRWDGLLSCLL